MAKLGCPLGTAPPPHSLVPWEGVYGSTTPPQPRGASRVLCGVRGDSRARRGPPGPIPASIPIPTALTTSYAEAKCCLGAGWRCACLRTAGLNWSRPSPRHWPSKAWQGTTTHPGAVKEAQRKNTAVATAKKQFLLGERTLLESSSYSTYLQ